MKCLRIVFLFFVFALSIPKLPAQIIDMEAVEAEEHFRDGIEAFHSAYYDKAVQSFEMSLSLKPDNSLVRTWLGRAFFQSGRVEQALHEWATLEEQGKANAWLSGWVEFLTYRRSLAPELRQEDRYVLTDEIDSAASFAFRRPTSITPRPDGSVFVTSWATNQIISFDANKRVKEILGGGIAGFNHPYSVIEAGEHLFVSEFHANRIAKCTLTGEKILTFGERGTAAGAMLGPQHMAADSRGYLYITEIGNRRLLKYNLDGDFILSVGQKTRDFPGFAEPVGVAIRDDRIFVSDRKHRKVFVFDSSGNYVGAVGDGQLDGPEGICFKNPQKLLVADTDRIVEIDLENETSVVLAEVRFPESRIVDVGIDANGNLMAVDHNSNRILIYTEVSGLYTGYFPIIEKIDSQAFPEVTVNVSVTNRDGKPVVGMGLDNFRITEFGNPVGDVEILGIGTHSDRTDITVLIEKSEDTYPKVRDIQQAVEDLFKTAQEAWRLKVVSAGDYPVVETSFEATRLQLVAAVNRGTYVPDWHFDEGVLRSASELIQSRSKRVIVFISSGNLNPAAYTAYTLMEIAQYLRNNAIAFYCLYLEPDNLHPDLEYLCAETGGTSSFLYRPEGTRSIVSDISAFISPLYFLRYLSPSNPDFGKRYIEIQIAVPFQNMSGRDESGYYAPLAF